MGFTVIRRAPASKARACLLLLFLAGCANPYHQNYLSTVERWPAAVTGRLLDHPGPPTLLNSDDMKKDAQSLLEDGYVLLGRSKFRDAQLDESQAVEQGAAVHAWVVLVSRKYVDTVTESVPFEQWVPGQTTITTETVTRPSRPEGHSAPGNPGHRPVPGRPGDSAVPTRTGNPSARERPNRPPTTVQRQVVRTEPGDFETTYVPVSTDYYDYAATFWAMSKPSPIGVLVQALGGDLKKQYPADQEGVVVKVVIHNYPAFNANLLKGDILTSLAGETITSPAQFFDDVYRHAGQKVDLEFLRAGRPQSLQLTLNPE